MQSRRALILVLLCIAGGLAWANWPIAALPEGLLVDRVVVRKSERSLEIFKKDTLVRSYRISLGNDPLGHKRQEGDGRTPEGNYVLDYLNRESAYHLSMHVSYPSKLDRDRAAREGVDPGGQIMIHGLPQYTAFLGSFHRFSDWTKGCMAMTNAEVDELARVVPIVTPIEILP